MWGCRCDSRDVSCFSGYFLLSGNSLSPTSDFLKEGIKVEKLLNVEEHVVEKHLKSHHWRGCKTSSAHSGVMRNRGHLMSS